MIGPNQLCKSYNKAVRKFEPVALWLEQIFNHQLCWSIEASKEHHSGSGSISTCRQLLIIIWIRVLSIFLEKNRRWSFADGKNSTTYTIQLQVGLPSKGLYLKAGIVQIIDQYIGLFLYPSKYKKRPMYWSIQITQGRQSDFRLDRLRHIVMTTYL